MLLNAQEYLSSFDSPNLAYATSGNDIDLTFLRKNKTTVYLIIPANTQTYGPIAAIFFEQLLQLCTTKEPIQEETSITLMMDEFANFPKMPSLAKGITYLRSYRIRICAFIQNIAQLKDVYGEQGKENFLACPLQLAFNITSVDDARYFSALAGYRSIQLTNQSLNQDLAMNVSVHQQRRELLLPEEIITLPRKSLLIFKKGFGVVRVGKKYYSIL